VRKIVSGIDRGQRQLNGPQTSGRDYRNLSEPEHNNGIRDDDVAAAMRDGVNLLIDVYRPATPGRYPVLIAASPYPRQIQNLGAPWASSKQNSRLSGPIRNLEGICSRYLIDLLARTLDYSG
jgi:predicted acyl esterase